MKECTVIVKKVYETKRSRTVTERTVTLSKEALEELDRLILEYACSVEWSSLNLLFKAFTDI